MAALSFLQPSNLTAAAQGHTPPQVGALGLVWQSSRPEISVPSSPPKMSIYNYSSWKVAAFIFETFEEKFKSLFTCSVFPSQLQNSSGEKTTIKDVRTGRGQGRQARRKEDRPRQA